MSFINSPNIFKQNVNRLTEYRIKLVLQYIAHCYLEMINEGKKYDFSKKGKLQKEDFLRNGLVEDYLSKKQYKDYYKNSISDNPNVEIYFQKEENQVYKNNGKLADDYIDISVKETKLSEVLSGETSDEIKFAIECKRIKEASDYNEYIKDIKKFSERPFTTFRLPFEGQIAFIESAKINYALVKTEINSRLKKSTEIRTIKLLSPLQIHDKFSGSYSSSHQKSFDKKSSFSIYHLFFNYSLIVEDNKRVIV